VGGAAWIRWRDRAEIWACSRSGLARSPLLQLKWSALAEFQSSGLRAIADLPPQRGIGAVVADEEGADHVAEFLDGLVGGVLGAVPASRTIGAEDDG
jgi:hypothetical protein